MIAPAQPDFDWMKWDAKVSQDKLRPGQSELSLQAEEAWIAAQVTEMRTDDRIHTKLS